MHKSSTHTGSLHDYKPRKLWKSIVSRDADSSGVTSNGLSRSSSTIIPKSKRSSMIISEPVSIRSTGLKRLSTISGFSALDSNNNTDLSIDPKERDFNLKLSGNRHHSIYLPDEDQEDDNGSMNFINMDDDQELDTLSSALEDYRIFTTKSTTPTKITHQENNMKKSRLSSLPSFSSTTTIDSQISVLHVSNSLWIGSTISDLEEDNEIVKNQDQDYFAEFDSENLFKYEDHEIVERTNRTSLVFV